MLSAFIHIQWTTKKKNVLRAGNRIVNFIQLDVRRESICEDIVVKKKLLEKIEFNSKSKSL